MPTTHLLYPAAVRGLTLAVVVTACVCVSRAEAAPLDQHNGGPFMLGSSEHVSYESTDVHADVAPELHQGATAAITEAPLGSTGTSGALVINATFDSSITNNPNSAAIQAMINNAIGIYQALFNDPINVSILFRYSTTYANGTPLPSGALAVSNYVYYTVPWSTYINALTGDATTPNDASANASLPGSALSTNVLPSSADGRAVGLTTPPAMFANGSVGAGGPYDGIVTLNSSQPFQLTRPPAATFYDALRSTEHEMDEVLGFGSYLNVGGSNLRPQDLFSWSAAGMRNLTSGGSRYFSIDDGTTNTVGFSQNPNGDFGDWLSGSCPQANPYVQNAFSCSNQASDVTQTSPESINLDVIGYDLIGGSTPAKVPTALTFSDSWNDKVACTGSNSHGDLNCGPYSGGKFTIKAVISSNEFGAAIDPSQFDQNTTVDISVGAYSFSGTLGDAPKYVAGATRAQFLLAGDLCSAKDNNDGLPCPTKVYERITLRMTTKAITVSISGKTGGDANGNSFESDIDASNFDGNATGPMADTLSFALDVGSLSVFSSIVPVVGTVKTKDVTDKSGNANILSKVKTKGTLLAVDLGQ